MLILIAESKTMREEQQPIAPGDFNALTPAGEAVAAEIMHRLEALPQAELMAETGLSATLATKLRKQIYEFPNKALGLKAIEAFTGVVFKALKYDALSSREQALCGSDVRIISSLYGLLRPDDIIKPYRLDFTTKAAPDGTALNTFWRKDATIELVKTLREQPGAEILNLLPADAAKCIDWKLVKRFSKVWKVDFVEFSDGGSARTPAANKLKTMRGTLLRQILREGMRSVADLRGIQSEDFLFEGTPVYSDHLQFIC